MLRILNVMRNHSRTYRSARRPAFEALELRQLLASNQFAIIGDYGVNNAMELAVANLVKSWSPAYIITTGDNNYPDGAASTIDANIGKYYHEFIGNYTGSYGAGSTTNRFFPSLGNHDWHATGALPYLNYFRLPGNQFPAPANERYYDFVQGPIHFFAIDSDSHEPDGTSSSSTQANWLRTRLAASTSPFNVVYFHHPPYSSGISHGSTSGMQWPFKEWGADVVLSGHEHLYERLNVGGLPYFVNGLGGRTIYSFSSTPVAGSQVRYNGNHGAQLVTVTSTSLTFDFYSITNGGTLIDRYVILSGQTSPSVSIDNVSVTEGDSGTGTAVFTVTLSAPSSQSVTVNFATANGTATAGSDYVARSGTLTFTSGVTTQTVAVTINGDTLDEVSETFFVNLSNPVGATISDGQGMGTITDNDPAPSVSINNVTVTEGNSGTLNAVFTVALSAASGQTVSVNYATANGTASAPGDYVAKSGSLQFSPGVTSQSIAVTVNGDTLDEANETFVVNLTSATNATISDGQGAGTINDDDVASPTGTLIAAGAVWKYLDTGVDQGTAWRSTTFDDSTWRSGPAQLGYGDNDEATVVAYGPDGLNRYITTYFRHAFTVADPLQFSGLTLRLLRDDGAVVYLNGQEVVRSNMPTGVIAFSTRAASWVSAPEESEFVSFPLSPSHLRSGTNVIAVEIHQAGPTSGDISFDLELTGALAAPLTRSFQDGAFPSAVYTGTRDTKIRSDMPNKTKGTVNPLEAHGNPDTSTLIKWDISSIPAGSSVQSATFTINVVNGSANVYEVYELKRNWVEGEATWRLFAKGSSWQVDGAQGSSDRGSVVLGTLSSSTLGTKTFSLNAAGISLVQSWVNSPAANFGIIVQDYSNTDSLIFSSRETSVAAERPALTVTYLPTNSSSVVALTTEGGTSAAPASDLHGSGGRHSAAIAERKHNHPSLVLGKASRHTGGSSSRRSPGAGAGDLETRLVKSSLGDAAPVNAIDAAIATMLPEEAGSISIHEADEKIELLMPGALFQQPSVFDDSVL